MVNKAFLLSLIATLVLILSCEETPDENQTDTTVANINFEEEKAAILETLNEETKAAFTRDYEGWKEKWIHEPFISKTYMEFPDSSMTETLGWDEIDDFVRTYIEDHPEPDPLPTLLDDATVRLYGTGAWVTYEQTDPARGLKRETRLMEKVDGQWKIAGMHTTIYGVDRASD